MNQKSQTPDERFLVQLCAFAKGEIDRPVLIVRVAKACGLKETAVKNIVKHLAQANLVEKVGDDQVALTTRGRGLVEDLRGC